MKRVLFILMALIFQASVLFCQEPSGSGPRSTKEAFIVINELMASNLTTVPDNYGEYDDWIELHNNTDLDFNLGGYFLSDNPANLDKWEIPAGTIIPASGYAIFWADEDSAQGPNHCNFKLSASGELLMLLNPQQEIVDSVEFGAQLTDMGYARVPNGYGDFLIQLPTFNAANSNIGTGEYLDNSNLLVYPNPTRDLLFLQPSRNTNDDSFSIINSEGNIIYKGLFTEHPFIDVSGWASGLYIFRSGAVHRKFLIP